MAASAVGTREMGEAVVRAMEIVAV